jgi:Fic family protein
MSKINQRPSWQSQVDIDDYSSPEESIESTRDQMSLEEEKNKLESNNSQQDSSLDVNLIIASFQEKLAQLTTELVVKDATIKQLTNIINNMRGKK